MAGYGTHGNIESKLQAFIQDIESSNANSPTRDEEHSIILYGQANLGVPHGHHKLRDIKAVRDETAQFKECEVLLRGKLQHHVLFRTAIHNSTLNGCVLIECTIYGSKIESSRLQDCRIRKKALGSNNPTSTTPFISCCQIENTTFYDAEIFNSTIDGGLSIQNCEIKHSLTINSLVIGSTLKDCGVDRSELYNCKVTGGVFTKSVFEVTNVMTLRKFPTELREMIYSHFIRSGGLGKDLVAALRPDPLLHSEVLETYFKEHIFLLSTKNHTLFSLSPKKMVQRICKLHINGTKGFPTSDVSIYFPIGTKINEIQIEFYGTIVNNHLFYDITKLWLKYFGTVLMLTVLWAPRETRMLLTTPPPSSLIGVITVANKWLKTEAVHVKGKSEARSKRTQDTHKWTWSAEKDTVLAWNA